MICEQAEEEGLHTILMEAGWDWREPGCSMCLAMNPDKLEPGERCASTSNRNFEGRQVRPVHHFAVVFERVFATVKELNHKAPVCRTFTPCISHLLGEPLMCRQLHKMHPHDCA